MELDDPYTAWVRRALNLNYNSVEEIQEYLKKERVKMSRKTIYKILKQFEEQQKITKEFDVEDFRKLKIFINHRHLFLSHDLND